GNDFSYGPSISADGRYVAFTSKASNFVPGDTNNAPDVFVTNRMTNETKRVSVSSTGAQGNADSGYWSQFYSSDGPHSVKISGNGRYVGFASKASNLVPDDTNGAWDVFVHDLTTRQTTRVSVSNGGIQRDANSGFYGVDISADGRYVVFASSGDVFLHDRT